MTKNQAVLYMTAICTLLALHITAPVILAFITGALFTAALKNRDP
jgi:hypothetical protein